MEEKAVAELDPILTKTGFTKAVEMIYEDMGLNLSKNLGIEYGGVLNNTNAKVAGKGYYDTANKKIYKCTANTSINYADAAYFIEVSNNDLLGKLQNLVSVSIDNLEVRAPQLFSQKLIPIGTKRIIIYAKNGSGSSAYHTPGTCIEYPFKHSGQSLAFIGMPSSGVEADGYIATFRETNGYLDLVRIEGETSNSNNNFICKIEFQLI